MYETRIKRVIRSVALLGITCVVLQPIPVIRAAQTGHTVNLPSPLCDSLQVPEGNKFAFHVYARGVQIYRWNGATWDFVAPVAALFAEANYFGEVGSHYVGPTWESKSGSKVVGRRVQGTGCTPDPSAIAWLRLEKVSTSGSGIFSSVTYIQRVNTTGGTPPTDSGLNFGEMREVPYTAEYYFYRAQD